MKFVKRLVPIQLPVQLSLANISQGEVRIYIQPGLLVLADRTGIDPDALASDLIRSAKEFAGEVCHIGAGYFYDGKFSSDRMSITLRTDLPIDEGKAFEKWNRMLLALSKNKLW